MNTTVKWCRGKKMGVNLIYNRFAADRKRYISLQKNRKWEEAEKLYWEKLYPVVEKRFLKDVRQRKRNGEIPDYDILILPLGLFNNYALLLIKALKPKKVFFLCVPEDEEKSLKNLVERAKLSPAQYEKVVVKFEDLNTSRSYEEVKKIIEKYKGKRIVIDLSKGKRSIIAGAAVAGEVFNCDLIHISKSWDENVHIPGTEKLIILNKSLYLFGDLENKHATELFNECSYDSASRIFKDIMQKTKDPRKFEIKYLISSAYAFWDGFYYKAAFLKLSEALRKIEQYGFDWTFVPQLKNNLNALKILEKLQEKNSTMSLLKNNKLISYLIIDLYCNAGRRKYQQKFEDALSRIYRAIELISQNRLAVKGINTADPNQNKIKPYLDGFKETAKKIYGTEKSFPDKIPLMDSHILLFVMKDELWSNKDLKSLKKLYEAVRLRDTSLVAHGLQSIDQKTYGKIKKAMKEIILNFFKITHENYDSLIKIHTHIKLE